MINRKKFLTGCAVLAGCGAVLAAVGIAFGGMVYGVQLGREGIQVNAAALLDKSESGWIQKEEKTEAFDRIEIDIDYANVKIMASGTDAYSISYGMYQNGASYEVSDGKLLIGQPHEKQKHYHTGFYMFSWGNTSREEYVTVKVPKNAGFSSVAVQTDSGNISCEQIQADILKLSADYGDVNLKEVAAQEMEVKMESGDLKIEQTEGRSCKVEDAYGNVTFSDVKLTEDMTAEMESGDIYFENIKLRDFNLDSSYGKIAGEQAEFRNMAVSAESGDCVWKDVLFQNCSIDSEYGDVKLLLAKPAADYGYRLNTEFGDIRVGKEKMGASYVSVESTKENLIKIQCESGNIRIDEK